MAAGRLLAPYFGTSTLVWCLLIGSVLSALSVGAYVGGRLAARERALRACYGGLIAAGILLAALPTVARPILRGAVASFHAGNASGLVAGCLAIAALLMVPVMVLGAIGPVLVHHELRSPAEAGAVAGRLGALGTAGSLLGTFVPGLLLVPWLGTERTFRLCGALLVAIGALGALRTRRALAGSVAALALVVAAIAGTESDRDRVRARVRGRVPSQLPSRHRTARRAPAVPERRLRRAECHARQRHAVSRRRLGLLRARAEPHATRCAEKCAGDRLGRGNVGALLPGALPARASSWRGARRRRR